MAEKIIMPLDNQLVDSFLEEEREWLFQWNKLNNEKNDDEANKCDAKRSNLLLHLKNVEKECGILKSRVTRMTRVNNDLKSKTSANLKEDFEKQTYKLQFVQLQNDQLTIERDGLLLQVQQENENYERTLQKLEELERSIEEMQNEFQREKTEYKKMHSKTRSALEEQEQNHFLEMDKLKQNLRNNNLEQTTCSICFYPWESFGGHRLVSLACGHLFGDNCIKACLHHAAECPICRTSAYTGDLQYIYDRNNSMH